MENSAPSKVVTRAQEANYAVPDRSSIESISVGGIRMDTEEEEAIVSSTANQFK